jgi:hypothetical protein
MQAEDRKGASLARVQVAPPPRVPATLCDACGSGMQPMGHCKWLCRRCGFLRTCIDTV